MLCRGTSRFFGLLECAGSGKGTFGLKSIGPDLAYKALLYEARTVSGNMHPISIPGVINGTYQTTYHVGSINLRVNF